MSGTSFEVEQIKGLPNMKTILSHTCLCTTSPRLLLQEVQKSYLGSGFLVGKGQVSVAHVPRM